MIFSGSRLQFGKIIKLPVDELHPLNPETPYAFHKKATEDMYQFYHKQHNIDTVVFRIANPYGPRGQIKHPKYSIINFFIRKAMEGGKISIFGKGNQIRDYIFVTDLANAFIAASVTDKSNGQVFNIGSGIGISFKKMVETIIDVVGDGYYEKIPWPKNYINVETGDYITDIRKIEACLEWSPEVSFLDGIKKTVEYYKSHMVKYI